MKQQVSFLCLWTLISIVPTSATFVRVPKAFDSNRVASSTQSTPWTVEPFSPLLVALIDEAFDGEAPRRPLAGTKRKGSRQQPQPSLYDVLGASPQATKAELKRKYLALAQQTHPDAIRHQCRYTGGSDRAHAVTARPADFTEIAAAYKTLSNPKERRRYDRELYAAKLVVVVCESLDRSVTFLGRVLLPELVRFTALLLSDPKKNTV